MSLDSGGPPPAPPGGIAAHDDGISQAELARVMRDVPWGPGTLAGAAVALLVLGWLAVYIFVFLPRGVVG